MTSLSKIKIQGIRSFGSADEDSAVIQFFKPLTLILGQNGSGKTTIIESLLYACIDEKPPNAKGGFIYDPKLQKSEVTARVTLELKDRKGDTIAVTRGMIATQKAKTVSNKTLTACLKRAPADGGESITVDTRCMDVNREMLSQLGVNKCILTDVIFCHQENSTWPLTADNALKNRFDKIFNAEKYSKVLEEMIKQRKGLMAEMKSFQEEMKHLKNYKDIVEDKERELKRNESSQASYKERMNQLQQKRVGPEAKLKELIEKAQEIYDTRTKMKVCQSEKNQLDKTCQELKEQIDHIFTGSKEELEDVIRNFDAEMEKLKRESRQFEMKLECVRQDINEMSNTKSGILVEKGKLEMEVERHKRLVKDRSSLIIRLSSSHNLPRPVRYSRGGDDMEDEESEVGGEDVLRFLTSLQDKMKRCDDEMERVRSEVEENIRQIQTKIEGFGRSKAVAEDRQKEKERVTYDKKEKLKEITKELSEVDASSYKLDGIDRSIKELEKKENDESKRVNVNQLQVEISDFESKKKDIDEKMRTLNSELTQAGLRSKELAAVESCRAELAEKVEQVKRIRMRHEDTLTDLLESVPSDGRVGEALDKYIRERERDVRVHRKKIEGSQIELSTLEANRISNRNLLAEKERSVKDFEAEMSQQFGSQDMMTAMDDLQRDISRLQDDKGQLEAIHYLNETWIKKLSKQNPCCPTCERGFKSRGEVEEVIQRLVDNQKKVPRKLESCKEDLEKRSKDYDKMLQLRPLRDQIANVKEQEIPTLKQTLKEIADKIEKEKDELEKNLELQKHAEGDFSIAQDMKADIQMMDTYSSNVKDLERRLVAQEGRLGGNSLRSVEQVSREREEVEEKREEISMNLERRRKRREEQVGLISSLRGRLVELKEERVSLNQAVQRRRQVEEERIRLGLEIRTLGDEVENAKQQVKPLQSKIEKLLDQKMEVEIKREKIMSQNREEREKMGSEEKEVKRIDEEIKLFESGDIKQKVFKLSEEVRKLENIAVEKEREREVVEGRVVAADKKLSQQQVNITLYYITLLHYIKLYYYITLHCIILHYLVLYFNTLHCITLHYITLHDITLHCIILQYITLYYSSLHYTTLHYIVLHYIVLYFNTLHCISLHYITLHYITLHYIVLLFVTHITPHYIILHYITLHYITLYYIILYFISH